MKNIFKSIFGKSESYETDRKKLQYWHLRGVHNEQFGSCSDNLCPCPQVRIPRGEGYIYIVKYPNEKYTANLTCETGARKRKLNLRIAHEDAKHWWETGMVPFRETPKNEAFQESPYKSKLSEYDQKAIKTKQKQEMLNYFDIVLGKKDNK